MPNIHLYQSHLNKGNPFAKFEYMDSLPTKNALDSFMQLCHSIRLSKIKLPQKFLKWEKRAFLALQNNEYVTTTYPWEGTITDCWLTTIDTWWADFLKQKEKWESK